MEILTPLVKHSLYLCLHNMAMENSLIIFVTLGGWSQDMPNQWSREQVLDWFSYSIERNKWDASTIDLKQCDMDGQRLCQLTKEDMRRMFGGLGDKLYDHLYQLKECKYCAKQNKQYMLLYFYYILLFFYCFFYHCYSQR